MAGGWCRGVAHFTREGDSSSWSTRKLKMATFCAGGSTDKGWESSWDAMSAISLGRLEKLVVKILKISEAVPAVMSMSFNSQPEAVQS